MTHDTPRVAALVVGYMPDMPVLDALLAGLPAQADTVVFVDNGGAEGILGHDPDQRARIHYIAMGGNAGLGAALNAGMEFAASQGCTHVATFDQDSELPPGLIPRLLQAHLSLRGQGVRCAAVGPRFYDRREGTVKKFPMYREQDGAIKVIAADGAGADSAAGLQEVDVLITSGMLVNLRAWREGLRYDEGLFVDYTDTDWCFRARAAGYRLFVCLDQEMGHAMSDAPPVRVFGVNLLCYPPLRRYYYFRNTIYFIRQPYVSPAWRKRLAAGLPVRFLSNVFIDRHKLAGLKMMLLGLWHGVRKRLGGYGA
ncbi:glycosyltransferase family 2 protein [Parapusillimonas granuli]|uniref:Glycosyltransferase family 2 protein n=1 Tax=Parapusillimonas granuli TaxID=380911 RepID=A0A853FYQ2_9BURK|nr:glycosyltransferase family 2 protein [Parapusillimonas granuli]MBB5217417.1 rhamnosyltransferase [Parapusillimonas granuli]NYT47761.1 glycosyltransferase family 2 protein [Parapusillimonas granuli]